MVMGDLFIPMGMFILANGKKTERMVKENMSLVMELFMMVNGKTINNQGMVKKIGRMEQYIRVTMFKEESRVKECLFGVMIAHMKEIFMIIIFMVKGNMSGKMEESMKVNGQTTKCMGKVFLFGQMGENTKVII